MLLVQHQSICICIQLANRCFIPGQNSRVTIALIRHGQTDWNAAGLFQGSTDIALNEVGREQARATARALAEAGHDWRAIVSSPLVRARETALIIAEQLGLELGPALPLWVERSYGIYEGAPDAPELKSHPSVEKMSHLIARGHRALAETEAGFERPTLVVAHGTIIRYTLNDIAGAHPEQQVVPRILNGALSTIRRNADGEWELGHVNVNPSHTSI